MDESDVVQVAALIIPIIAVCLLFAVLVYLPVRWMLIRRGWRVTLDVLAVGIACFGVWMAVSISVTTVIWAALGWLTMLMW